MKTYGTRPQDLLKEGLITEAEYNLKLALEENKELKVKLDAVKTILENAQGEWSGIQEVYAPEWTQPLKQCCDIIEQAQAQKRET